MFDNNLFCGINVIEKEEIQNHAFVKPSESSSKDKNHKEQLEISKSAIVTIKTKTFTKFLIADIK